MGHGSAYRIFRKSERKRSGSPRCSLENDIKMDPKDVVGNWINVT
jgi:hypothetical protein